MQNAGLQQNRSYNLHFRKFITNHHSNFLSDTQSITGLSE